MKSLFTVLRVASLVAVLLTSVGALTFLNSSENEAAAYPGQQKRSHDFGGMGMKPGEYAAGTIASLQNDENGIPTWIVSGHWKASMTGDKQSMSSSSEMGATNSSFKASFNMVMTNGSAMHEHKISNFTLTEMSTPDNQTMVFNGTSVVTMRDGPVEVPTSVTVLDGNVVSIQPDPVSVNNHFGDTPIYGTVTKAIKVYK